MQRAFWLAVVLSVPSIAGCKSKMGDTCSGSALACADESTRLICRHDRFQAQHCDGPKGCKAEGEKVVCDYGGNKVGSECDDDFLAKPVCHDDKSALGCRNGRHFLYACGGPNGCKAPNGLEGRIECDTSVAKEGAECDRALSTKPACEADGKRVVECTKSGKFELVRYCRGPRGCSAKKGEVDCDGSVQQVGDPCTPPITEVCSPDGVAVLLCDGSKVFEKVCPGSKGCAMSGGSASCDSATPHEGSMCEQQGQRRCQKAYEKDPDKVIECDGKKFKAVKKCKTTCQLTRPSTYACKEDK